MNLIEEISAEVHDQWMATKISQGVFSRLSETGEELMVDYSKLSESAKDLDRGTVRTVLLAVKAIAASLRDGGRLDVAEAVESLVI